MEFGREQQEAIACIAAWLRIHSSPFFYLAGYAGTGKTTLAKHIAALQDEAVLYGAFTGKAAQVMQSKGCHGAQTLHSMLWAFERDYETGLYTRTDVPKEYFKNIGLIIVDECSMVNSDVGEALLSKGVPVLVLGDPAQLPPVQGAGYFTSDTPHYMLTEIHRQAKDSPIIRLATDVREGRGIDYGTYGDSWVIRKRDLAQSDVLQADQVLVGRNETRMQFNNRMREIMGYRSAVPEQGERLICLKNYSSEGLTNGGLWDVVDVLPKKSKKSWKTRMLISPADGILFENGEAEREVSVAPHFFKGTEGELDWKKAGPYQFTYGYTITVHKSQGSQWDNVTLFDESAAFRDSRKEWLYTGITRAAERITIVR